MGGRLVRRLLAAEHQVVAYDVVPAARERTAADGARVASSLGEVVDAADVILSSLPMPADVESVLNDVLPRLRSGQVWIDLSTIDPATAKKLAALLATRDAFFLDAPVSGGPKGADAGTLAVMVGGDAVALERAMPALDAFSRKVFHVGPVGAGTVVKLANQMLVGVHTIAAMEAANFVARAGLDPQVALDVISVSTGDSAMLRRSIREFVTRRDFTAQFSNRLLTKDLRLYAQEARGLGTNTPAGTPALDLYEQAMAAGLESEDYASVLKLIER
jgi:3-hydroxyisobutyrate dehydrogenase/2-hydroxy-3-oxopropionate reductase